jgi:hypothetical protein
VTADKEQAKMTQSRDVAALSQRIESWPEELGRALIAAAHAEAKVGAAQRQVERARDYGASRDADDDEDGEDDEGYVPYMPSRASLRYFGKPQNRAEAAAKRKYDRAGRELEQARATALARLVASYEGQKGRPAKDTLNRIADNEPAVIEKREAYERAGEELEDIELQASEQTNPSNRFKGFRKREESSELRQCEQELSEAETQAALAQAEVSRLRAVGKSLAMLARLVGAEVHGR